MSKNLLLILKIKQRHQSLFNFFFKRIIVEMGKKKFLEIVLLNLNVQMAHKTPPKKFSEKIHFEQAENLFHNYRIKEDDNPNFFGYRVPF